MSEITMNDLMVAIKDVASDVNNLNAKVKFKKGLYPYE